MFEFNPTHQLVSPAGEEIPVLLISQQESLRYLIVSAEEYLEGSEPIYEWHPSEGVSYSGIVLDGLKVEPLPYCRLFWPNVTGLAYNSVLQVILNY